MASKSETIHYHPVNCNCVNGFKKPRPPGGAINRWMPIVKLSDSSVSMAVFFTLFAPLTAPQRKQKTKWLAGRRYREKLPGGTEMALLLLSIDWQFNSVFASHAQHEISLLIASSCHFPPAEFWAILCFCAAYVFRETATKNRVRFQFLQQCPC
jgi:hypothetical protein